jgi:hypothetical protein
MQEDIPETIENTSEYDSKSGDGAKKVPDEMRRAIS